MVIASARLALRMLVLGVLCAIALMLFEGRAHAADATSTDGSTQQSPGPATTTPTTNATSSTPPPTTGGAATTPPTSPPATAPPPGNTSQQPSTQQPATQQQPASGTTGSPSSDQQSTTPPPSGAQAQPTSPTPAGASGPGSGNSGTGTGTGSGSGSDAATQNANVGTQGTSVSNTGGNGSVASGNGVSTPPTPTGGGTATGAVQTGTSDATGSDSTSGIDQQAKANATDQGAVDILQIALVVNVGVGNSNSGNNVVGAGSGAATNGTVAGKTQSGDASAVGDESKTGIKQSAVVGNGDKSNQTAFVVNIGIGIGNSGLNITIGTVNNNGQAAGAQSVTAGQTTGQVTTGNAGAIGDKSKSQITQLAGGLASGAALLTIDQRAIVVNFGTAIANSGGNFAFASFDPSSLTPEESQIVQAVLAILAPFFAPQSAQTTGSGTAGSLGGTIAQVISGNASALGNASQTDINQSVMGNVSGNGSASATQRAEVGNFGLALANSGFNGALAGLPGGAPGTKTQLLAAQNALVQFLSLLTNLDWLNSANPFAQFTQTIDLGGVTLNLGGSLEGDQFLLGWDSGYAPDGGPIPGGVRVRQISGVLNIGFSTSDTGDNTVVAIVTASHEGTGPALSASNGVNTGSADVLGSVLSGDATAVGNMSDVMVCQAFHTTITCRPPAPKPSATPPPNATPPVRPVVLAAHETSSMPTGPSPAAAAAPAAVLSAGGTLPFTGGDGQTMIEIAGGLLAVGAAAASRRRRNQRV